MTVSVLAGFITIVMTDHAAIWTVKIVAKKGLLTVTNIKISQDFDSTRWLGDVVLNAYGKNVFEEMKKSGVDMVIAPAFIIKKQDPDGTILEVELISMSVIPAKRAIKKEERSDDEVEV